MRIARKICKRTYRQWEKEHWDEILEKAAEARDKNDMGKMFKLLRKLGMRDCKITRPSEYFSLEEPKSHFEKVLQERQEVASQIINWVFHREEEMRKNVKRAGEELEKNLEIEKIEKAMREMKEGVPGIYGVSIKMINFLMRRAQKEQYN